MLGPVPRRLRSALPAAVLVTAALTGRARTTAAAPAPGDESPFLTENTAAMDKMMAGMARMVDRARSEGALRKAPLAFVLALMNSVAETTMDFMIREPAHAGRHCKVGFDAFWRAIA